jgi:hypothetical protein
MTWTTEVLFLGVSAFFLSHHFRSSSGKRPAIYPVYAAGTSAGWAMKRTTSVLFRHYKHVDLYLAFSVRLNCLMFNEL